MEASQKVSPFRLSSLLRLEKNPKQALHIFQTQKSNQKPFRYSRLSYDLIITKLGRAKMFHEMEEIFEQMKQETRFSPKEILFCNVISFYGRSRMAGPAVSMYDRIPSFNCPRTVKSLNALLHALSNCREFDRIREISADLKLYAAPDACTYNTLMNACCMNDSLHGAWHMFEEMRSKGIRPNVVTFGILISALCANSRLDEALRLKNKMIKVFDVRPNVFVYTLLIKGLCKANRLDLAFKLKEEMSAMGEGIDSAVYSTLITALFRAGRRGEVVTLLEEMKHNGCKPDTVTYNAMISGLCGDKDLDSAFGVLDEMVKDDCKPDVVSYNVLMSGLCRGGRLREAMDLFEDMPRRECCPDVVSYRILLGYLCDGKEFEEAAFLLGEMVFKGFKPHLASVVVLVEALCREGKMELLNSVLCSLGKVDAIEMETWNVLITMLCKSCNTSKEFELMDGLITLSDM